MKNMIKLCILGLLCMCGSVNAATQAGTVISNKASVTFTQGSSVNITFESNLATFVVDELIDVQVNWVDAVEVAVSSPDTNKVITFDVVNSGNGIQKFRFEQNYNIGGGSFNPIRPIQYLYIENNLQSGFQNSGIYSDILYVVGNEIEFNAGETKTVYLLSNIPENLVINNQGFVELRALSTVSGIENVTAAGQTLPGAGVRGTDAVVGSSLGRGFGGGNYIVRGLIVNNLKTVESVVDANGGNLVATDSIISYKIEVNIIGVGMVKNLRIEDVLPSTTTYIVGSLKLNGVPLSDRDNVIGNSINVIVGDVMSPMLYALIFQVRVN